MCRRILGEKQRDPRTSLRSDCRTRCIGNRPSQKMTRRRFQGTPGKPVVAMPPRPADDLDGE